MLIFALQFHVTNRMPDHKVAAQENRLSCCENCVFTRRRTTQQQQRTLRITVPGALSPLKDDVPVCMFPS